MAIKEFPFDLDQEVYVLEFRGYAFELEKEESCKYCLGTGKLLAKNGEEVDCPKCWGRGSNTKSNEESRHEIIIVKYKINSIEFSSGFTRKACEIKLELIDDQLIKEHKIDKYSSARNPRVYYHFNELGNAEINIHGASYSIYSGGTNYKPDNMFSTLEEAKKALPAYQKLVEQKLLESYEKEKKEKDDTKKWIEVKEK
mgnify:CR=1 FL=1